MHGFRIEDIRIGITSDSFFKLVAVWRDKPIGALILQPFHDPCLAENEWSVFKVEVLPQFRRKGVATRLYDEADALVADAGYELVPTPPAALSNDGWKFWYNRDLQKILRDPRSKSILRHGRRTPPGTGKAFTSCIPLFIVITKRFDNVRMSIEAATTEERT